MGDSWGRAKQWLVAAALIVLLVGRYAALAQIYGCVPASTYVSGNTGDPPFCYLVMQTMSSYFHANENEWDVSVRRCAGVSATFLTGETRQTTLLSFSSLAEARFVAHYVNGLVGTADLPGDDSRYMRRHILLGMNPNGWTDGSPARPFSQYLQPVGQKCLYFFINGTATTSFTVKRCMTVDEFAVGEKLFIVCKAMNSPMTTTTTTITERSPQRLQRQRRSLGEQRWQQPSPQLESPRKLSPQLELQQPAQFIMEQHWQPITQQPAAPGEQRWQPLPQQQPAAPGEQPWQPLSQQQPAAPGEQPSQPLSQQQPAAPGEQRSQPLSQQQPKAPGEQRSQPLSQQQPEASGGQPWQPLSQQQLEAPGEQSSQQRSATLVSAVTAATSEATLAAAITATAPITRRIRTRVADDQVLPDVQFNHNYSWALYQHAGSKMHSRRRRSGAKCELSTAQVFATSLAAVVAGGLQ